MILATELFASAVWTVNHLRNCRVTEETRVPFFVEQHALVELNLALEAVNWLRHRGAGYLPRRPVTFGKSPSSLLGKNGLGKDCQIGLINIQTSTGLLLLCISFG